MEIIQRFMHINAFIAVKKSDLNSSTADKTAELPRTVKVWCINRRGSNDRHAGDTDYKHSSFESSDINKIASEILKVCSSQSIKKANFKN